jgi:hypothetical protein
MAQTERWFIKENDSKERRDKLEQASVPIFPASPSIPLNSSSPPTSTSPLTSISTQFPVRPSAGPLLLVRPRVVGLTPVSVPFMEDKPRNIPSTSVATGRWHDSFDITLPAGYVVDETPDPVDVDVDFAAYHSTVTAKDNHLHYEREYVVRQVEIPAEKAAAFRHLESAILTDEKGTAVLKKQ